MPLQNEILRKLIHLSSLIYPIHYYIYNFQYTIILLSCITAIVLLWDFLRMYNVLQLKVFQIFNYTLRHHELQTKSYSGASYFMLAITFTVLIFPKNIAVLTMIILVFCDSSAAIIGKLYPKNRIFNKSLAGLIAYNIAGFIVIILCYQSQLFTQFTTLNWIVATIAVFISSLAELYEKYLKIDDNLLICGVYASILYLSM